MAPMAKELSCFTFAFCLLLPAQELNNILETLHLLRSPVNAQRPFSALAHAEAGKETPESQELKLK